MRTHDRAGRIQQVVAILDAHPRTMTTHQIVKQMGLKRSPYAVGIVYKAYELGLITGYTTRHKNGKDIYNWHSKKTTFDNQRTLGL